MNIILASGSPRRRELLAQAGFEFKVEVSNADENVVEESPEQMVEELAARKAEAVVRLHNKAEDNCLVIGADTIVVLEGDTSGKYHENTGGIRKHKKGSAYSGGNQEKGINNRDCTHEMYISCCSRCASRCA